jgi:hypothetical protein
MGNCSILLRTGRSCQCQCRLLSISIVLHVHLQCSRVCSTRHTNEKLTYLHTTWSTNHEHQLILHLKGPLTTSRDFVIWLLTSPVGVPAAIPGSRMKETIDRHDIRWGSRLQGVPTSRFDAPRSVDERNVKPGNDGILTCGVMASVLLCHQ